MRCTFPLSNCTLEFSESHLSHRCPSPRGDLRFNIHNAAQMNSRSGACRIAAASTIAWSVSRTLLSFFTQTGGLQRLNATCLCSQDLDCISIYWYGFGSQAPFHGKSGENRAFPLKSVGVFLRLSFQVIRSLLHLALIFFCLRFLL